MAGAATRDSPATTGKIDIKKVLQQHPEPIDFLDAYINPKEPLAKKFMISIIYATYRNILTRTGNVYAYVVKLAGRENGQPVPAVPR